MSKDTTPPHSNITTKKHHKHFSALNVDHEIQARNYLPATDIKRGWVIDSGASAHMTPYKRDCKDIQQTYRKIFLADGSSVHCNQMGNIDIPIKKRKQIIGILRLEDVLIVPTLDRRLFSVNSFLSRGNNRVLFQDNYIELGIKGGPKIKIPITSLQSNAMIVNSQNQQCEEKQNHNKTKINSDIIHNRFHRSYGTIATIKAHDLWEDTYITEGTDSICISCKTMSIPAHSRTKSRQSIVNKPLEEIQVDTVPNPEPVGISNESKVNYFLILCDRYSRIFRAIGLKDKSSEACIDGIEQLISNFPCLERNLKSINHIRSDAGTEFRSDTFRKWCGENKINFDTAAPKHQENHLLNILELLDVL